MLRKDQRFDAAKHRHDEEIIAACLREIGILAYPTPKAFPNTGIEITNRSKKFTAYLSDCQIIVSTAATPTLIPEILGVLELADPECFEKIKGLLE